MKIYFGKADPQDIVTFGDEGVFKLVRGDETQYFYQGVEHGTNAGGIDEVAIFDGCNRKIPIAIDQIPELVEALNYCYNAYQDIELARKREKEIESNREVFVDRNTDHDYCYVDDSEEKVDF